jgi:hypothetical protein
MSAGVGPGNKKRSTSPLSEIQCDSLNKEFSSRKIKIWRRRIKSAIHLNEFCGVPPSEISTKVSEGLK